MKVAILHLSDIHIDGPRHPILNRVDRIVQAVAARRYSLQHIIIVITGDIAHSGAADEYVLASSFLDNLASALKQVPGDPELSYVFVPGNHDCDLRAASDVRQPEIIELKLGSLDLDGQLVNHFLAVQASFFKFTSLYERESLDSAKAQLCHLRNVRCGDTSIRFCCFNTAWLTQNPEKPSRLYFPMKALEELDLSANADLTISLFHHPFNWLNPVNAQDFKQAVETLSDLMLSGHEHHSDIYSKSRSTDNIIHGIEADALWEPRARTSAFNLLVFDFPSTTYEVTGFDWHDGFYLSKHLIDWGPFERNPASRIDQIENNSRFKRELSDLGTGFSHRRSLKDLNLPDLFIYPDLIKRLFAVRTSPKPKDRIRSVAVLEHIWAHKHSLIIGEGKSGKTSLAKTLYRDLQRKDVIPLLLKGHDLRGSERRILDSIDQAYIQQYSQHTLEAYKQKPTSAKLLIIDDFHRSQLSADQQLSVLALLKRLAERIILFVDESIFQIAEIASAGSQRPLADFEYCEIAPFCPSLRRALVRRWVEYGASDELSTDELSQEMKARNQVLETFLPKRALPPYPINILGLLQAYDTNVNLNTANGSYGELCESMITERLRLVSKKPAEIPRKYSFLSRLAY